MDNKQNKEDVELIEGLINGLWENLENDNFNWEYVTNIEVLNSIYCIITFGDNEQYTLYKYKLKIWKKN